MRIIFQPSGVIAESSGNENLLDIIRGCGLALPGAVCGGRGVCGKCGVSVNGNFKLACHFIPTGDITVRLPEEHADTLGFQLPPDFIYDKFESDGFGCSFDIGTTTIAGAFIKLRTGYLLGVKSVPNPQSAYGADVITRIGYAACEGGLSRLLESAVSAMNGIINDFLREHGLLHKDIKAVTAAGNTAMSHILMNVDPSGLAVSPFHPVFLDAPVKTANDLGLLADPEAPFTLLPNIAGHVGGDISAGLLATSLPKKAGITLLIDIGTNGEIVLNANGRMAACSTAAGPAFEGACIKNGMSAGKGAIRAVSISENKVTVDIIGGGEPAGICGSGLVDAVSEMLRTGVLEGSGRLARDESFVLCGGDKKIVVTQHDIRQVQLAKAAISAGVQVLTAFLGVRIQDIDEILLAGAFGNYINIQSAINIGLLPGVNPSRVKRVGNAAGIGAAMALLSESAAKKAAGWARTVEHVELSAQPGFMDAYINGMSFNDEIE
ncbi:MAG: ASKHA domain-containing protein [Defluviitaleaceae bacterium]|nr:ASKHA domain-containing protein [Defluviitaleaceae bacterium]MCL2836630.1 ASKHA domain-containing protein [Defluviitaleaceae bacterium]